MEKISKVAIYPRVSTLEQAEHGYSIDEQLDKLKKYCELRDWAVYDNYVDAGFSGSNINRPALQKLISDAKLKKFDTVLVYKLDRLSRSQKDTLYLIEDVFNANGINFVSVSENFDTSTPFGKAMIGILSVFAQLEREQIKERMQLGKLGRAKAGFTMAWSKVPFGYEYDKAQNALVQIPLQAQIVRQLFDEYLAGMSITKLRDKLNEEGHIGKDRKWSYRTLRQTLDNPVYIGKQKFKGEVYDCNHEPIIDAETYNAVQNELKIRQKKAYEQNNNPRPFQAKYMMSGIARCGYCKAPLTLVIGKRYKTNEPIYRYQCYNRMHARKKTAPVTIYNDNKFCDSGFYYKEDIEKYVIESVAKLQNDKEYLKCIISTDNTPKIDREALEQEIVKLDKKISKLNDLYMLDLISMDELKSKTELLVKDKKALDEQILSADADNSFNSKTIEKIESMLNIDIMALDYESQKNIVNSLIEKVDVTADTVNIHWKF